MRILWVEQETLVSSLVGAAIPREAGKPAGRAAQGCAEDRTEPGDKSIWRVPSLQAVFFHCDISHLPLFPKCSASLPCTIWLIIFRNSSIGLHMIQIVGLAYRRLMPKFLLSEVNVQMPRPLKCQYCVLVNNIISRSAYDWHI